MVTKVTKETNRVNKRVHSVTNTVTFARDLSFHKIFPPLFSSASEMNQHGTI